MEKEAPEGYTLNPERMYFEILEDGKVVKATMTDVVVTKKQSQVIGEEITI